jgi:hypothetical protein
MVLLTQHYDSVTAVGSRSGATIMMVPYSPAGMTAFADQITQALVGAKQAEENRTNGIDAVNATRPEAVPPAMRPPLRPNM